MTPFIHLHNHTEYSLLDGACRIKDIMPRLKELGMNAMAITDHGVMYGVIKFYKEAKKHGIKPILGCEVYTSPRSRFDREGRQDAEPGHLVLLAENNTGWHNLLKIVSLGFTDGFYYKPRVDFEVLERYSEGIIALSACLAGDIPRSLMESNYQKAKDYAIKYSEIFGKNNFFIELQDHGIEQQRQIAPQLIAIARELNLGLVVTNDAHYVTKQASEMHDALVCIQTGKTINDTARLRFDGEEFYIKSGDEMAELFPNVPEAVENTLKIAERCNVEIEFGKMHLPKYEIPNNQTPFDYIKSLCLDGLEYRYGEQATQYYERLDYELGVIESMGFIDYFLIVWDFVKYAKDNDIMVGPGRGSGAGSIVAYALRITDVDPMKYNLLFERFLNPERISMPDFDIDFCIERRQEVIDYVTQKYGKDNVTQIVTFGTLGAKQAVRDVARVLSMPYADADKISKLIPFELKMTIEKALDMSADLNNAYENDEEVRKCIDIARELEGMPRHASTHAAGVVICEEPVTNFVPLSKNGDIVTTQFDMDTIQEMGLLKMDFLGLRNLTVMRYALELIKKTKGIEIDLSKIDYNIKEVYEPISLGLTEGIFQLESSGMKQFMRELKPQSLEDIIAGISLFRPGPMEQIPVYVRNKNNPQGVTYKHPLLKNILNVTYGCMVYQEQVMQIVRDLAGYSLGQADLVRRAMSKKKFEVMQKERQKFIYGEKDKDGNVTTEGALNRGVDEATANAIFDEMMEFANYAFNKSHAAAYAFIAYQTAYLKYFYPTEYMAALLSSVLNNTTKVIEYINECSRMKISLLPPDVNKSDDGFTVDGNDIRFGLAAIKNVGVAFVNRIIEERENGGAFKTFKDFCNRLQEGEGINKRVVESLIKAGAFDCLGLKRAQLYSIYDNVIDCLAQDKKKNIEGQFNLFNMEGQAEIGDDVPNIDELPMSKLLAMEKDVMGIYISGHPLGDYRELIEKVATANSAEVRAVCSGEEQIQDVSDGATVTLAGIIQQRKDKMTKNGAKMAYITLEDLFGSIEVIVFPKTLDKYSPYLTEDNAVFIKGRLDFRDEGEPKLLAEEIRPLNDLPVTTYTASQKLYLKFKITNNILRGQIVSIFKKYKGNSLAYFFDEDSKKNFLCDITQVDLSDELLQQLSDLIGKENVKVK